MIGVWAGLFLVAGVMASGGWWPVLSLVPVVAWLGLRGAFPATRARAVAMLGLAGIAAVGVVRAETVTPLASLATVPAIDRIEGRVVSPVQSDLQYQRFDVEIGRYRSGEDWSSGDGVVRVIVPRSPAVGYGDVVGLTGDLVPVEDAEQGYRGYLRQQGLSGSVFGRSVWVERPGTGPLRELYGFGSVLAERLRRAVPGEAGILLGGLVVGDDSALSRETTDDFRRTGMSHITAVSGSNLALVVVLLMAVGGPIGLRRHILWLVAVVLAVWLYAAVTGLEPPVVRAALMATLALAAPLFGRRPDYLAAAVLSAAGMLLVDPALIGRIGFQLSLSASVALAALAAGTSIVGPGSGFRLVVNGAIVAQVATLPIVVFTFGSVPLVSAPLNVVVGPLVAIAFPVAFAGSLLGIVSPAAGGALMTVAGGFGQAILALTGAAADLPVASVIVPELAATGKALVLLLATGTVLLLSRDGRRWLGRLVGTAARATRWRSVPVR